MTNDKPANPTCAGCAHRKTGRLLGIVPTMYCAHPLAVDPVTGKPTKTCAEQRAHVTSDRSPHWVCGDKAALWEPIRKPLPPVGDVVSIAQRFADLTR